MYRQIFEAIQEIQKQPQTPRPQTREDPNKHQPPAFHITHYRHNQRSRPGKTIEATVKFSVN
jgi:hypothetical protein